MFHPADRSRAALATLSLLTTLLLTTSVLAQDATFDPMASGRALTQHFYEAEFHAVRAAFTPEVDEAMGGEEGLRGFLDLVQFQLGAEVEVLDESVEVLQGIRLYQRIARFELVDDAIAVHWAFDEEGRVVGFAVQPASATEAAPSRFLDYRTQAELRLPFEGEWTVVWGGREVVQNYHAAYADQRFAYDLLVVIDDATHVGDGTANEDYHCFGLDVLAPAAGRVVAVADGMADNVPGETNTVQVLGNHVIIDHGEEEYSFLAHLQMGSVAVEAGDPVEAGTVVGRCGNSGNSSEPHLHYHLQNSPEPLAGEGLPAFFVDYFADDEPVELGEPVQGQRLRPW